MRRRVVVRRGRRFVLALGVMGVLGAVTASAASATVYCVKSGLLYPPGCPTSALIKPTAEPTLVQALADANASGQTTGSDTIILPAGTQTTATTSSSFNYSGNVPMTIEGQGASSTTLALESASVAFKVLEDAGTEPSITVSSLRVALPSDGLYGIDLTSPATIDHVDVSSASGSDVDGIGLEGGGTVSDTTVTTSATALAVDETAPATIEDSTLSGDMGITDNGTGQLLVHRCAISADSAGTAIEETANGASISVDDALLQVPTDGEGLGAQGSQSSITAKQVTIVGVSGSIDVSASDGATANVSDSIIVVPTVGADAIVAGAGTTVTPTYSDFNPAADVGTGTITQSATNTSAAPQFASATDFRLDATSPLIDFDKADTTIGTGESATDLLGAPRITGGGRDLGAYQHQPPTVTSSAVSPSSVVAGSPASFSASGAVATPGDSLSYGWKFDDGGTATGATVSHAFTSAGSHSGTVTVTDLTGLTATATVKLNVTAPSNAFSVVSRKVSKSGVVALGVLVHAPGKLSAAATFSQKAKARRHHKAGKPKTVVFGSVSLHAATGGTFTLTIKPTRAALALLKADKKLSLKLVIAFTPTDGTINHTDLTLTVKAPKPKHRKI
jgi:PKD domain